MLESIKQFITSLQQDAIDSVDVLSSKQRELASAALLLEVATIDQHLDERELEKLQSLLESTFSLSAQEVKELTTLAQQESGDATSLYQFTQHINRHSSAEDKFQLVCGLWEVAYADGELDKYEEHIIRRIVDLIHVSHSDFIRAKHQARSRV